MTRPVSIRRLDEQHLSNVPDENVARRRKAHLGFGLRVFSQRHQLKVLSSAPSDHSAIPTRMITTIAPSGKASGPSLPGHLCALHGAQRSRTCRPQWQHSSRSKRCASTPPPLRGGSARSTASRRLRTRSRSWTADECRVPAQIPRVDMSSRYDLALSRAFMADDDIWALTNARDTGATHPQAPAHSSRSPP